MYNKVTLVGNLGRDPEQKSERGPVTFSVATTERYRKDGVDKEETQWHNVQAWGKLGEICRRILHKGDKVLVEGSLEYHEYEGKQYARVKLREMKKLSSPRGGGGGNGGGGNSWGQPQKQNWGQPQQPQPQQSQQQPPPQQGWGQPQQPQQQPPQQPQQQGWSGGGWGGGAGQHTTKHVSQPVQPGEKVDDPIPF